MHGKTSRTNGAITIFYGVSCLLAGAAGLTGFAIWVYRISSGDTDFSWSAFLGITITSALLGLIGYSITKVGLAQLK